MVNVDLVNIIISLAIAVITFFFKRTLNNIENSIKLNEKKIEEQDERFTKYKYEHLKTFQSAFDEQTKTISELIAKNNDYINKKIDVVSNNTKSLEKEFNSFKQYVATNYTKQEDFASQTRDINKKLDDVYGEVKEVVGLLKKMGVKN